MCVVFDLSNLFVGYVSLVGEGLIQFRFYPFCVGDHKPGLCFPFLIYVRVTFMASAHDLMCFQLENRNLFFNRIKITAHFFIALFGTAFCWILQMLL